MHNSIYPLSYSRANKKKYKLRRWVKDVLFLIAGMLVIILLNHITSSIKNNKFTLDDYNCYGDKYAICISQRGGKHNG